MCLPELFIEKLEDCLRSSPPSWNYKKDYFYYMVNYLVIRGIQYKDREFFPIDTQNLRNEIVSNIHRYIAYLINCGLLERDYFVLGKKAYHYRLNPNFDGGVRYVQIQPGTRLYQRIIMNQRRKRNHDSRMPEYLKVMWEHFKRVEFDYVGAREWIEKQNDLNKRYSYHASLSLIEDKRFRYFKRNRTNGRLDTNLTSLKKDLRVYLLGNNASIDLTNSQPFILSQILSDILEKIIMINPRADDKEKFITIPLCRHFFEVDFIKMFGYQAVKDLRKIRQKILSEANGELLKFQSSCARGSFYDDFLLQIGDPSLSRDIIKKSMLAAIYSRNSIDKGSFFSTPYQIEKERFASVYPTIADIIKVLKQKDHRNLSILLQRIESTIFIDRICPRLVKVGIVPLTIHDSVIVKEDQAEKTMEICRDVFMELFRVIPTFHCERLKGKRKNDKNDVAIVSTHSEPLKIAV